MVVYEVHLHGMRATARQIMSEGQRVIQEGAVIVRMSESSPIEIAFISGIVTAKVLPGLEVVEAGE